MHNHKFLFVALFATAGFSSSAQTKTIISLKLAVDSALHNYPELKAKRFQVVSANASVTDAENQRTTFVKDQRPIGFRDR